MSLVTVSGAVLGAQDAGATPKPTVAQVQAQVNQLQAQVDQIGQQYDSVSQQVAAAKQRLASVQQQSKTDQSQYDTARGQLRKIAVLSYENANAQSVAALLTAGDPSDVLAQASLLDEMASTHSEQVSSFLQLAQQAATTKANVQRTETGVSQLQTQLAQKKSSLQSLLNQESNLLTTLSLSNEENLVGGGGTFITSATDPLPENTPGEVAVHFAYSKLGTPYEWGGTGPDYDCSGLVQAAWAAAGVSIPRTTYEQWAALPAVSTADLQPGDLMFYDGEGHVAIYVGGDLIIDAPRTGEDVRLLSMNTDWYAENFDGARRP